MNLSNKEWPTTSNNFCPMCGHSEMYHNDGICTYVIDTPTRRMQCGCKKLMDVGVR